MPSYRSGPTLPRAVGHAPGVARRHARHVLATARRLVWPRAIRVVREARSQPYPALGVRWDDTAVILCHTRWMIELTREMIAYGLIATVAVVAVPATVAMMRRRRREKLRRRGIKTYGH